MPFATQTTSVRVHREDGRLLAAANPSCSERSDRKVDSEGMEGMRLGGRKCRHGASRPTGRMNYDTTIPVDRMHASEIAGRDFALKILLK